MKNVEENKISVLLICPDKYPKMVEIEDTLESMQNLVGGDIQEYMPFDDEVAIVCNDNGKIMGLPLNRAIYSEENPSQMLDVIAGNFFVTYAPIDSEKFLSLPPDLEEKYKQKFKFPERFALLNSQIKAVPYKPTRTEHER